MSDEQTTRLATALSQLDDTTRAPLEVEFHLLACLQQASPIAAWADGWCYRMDVPRGLDDRRDFTPPGLDTVPDSYLLILRNRFGQSTWCCATDPWLAMWCRLLVESMQDELDRRVWRRANEEARFQIVAAEENRRAREGKPPPDLRGLPTWREVSGPPAQD